MCSGSLNTSQNKVSVVILFSSSLFEAWGMEYYILRSLQDCSEIHIQDLTGVLAVGLSHYSRGTLMIVSCLIWFGFHLC